MQNNQQKNSQKAKLRPGQISRPKNLNLFTIRLPINALVSILHRATGCALFLILPIILLLLQLSLSSAQHYETVIAILHSPAYWVGMGFFSSLFCGSSAPCNGRALDDNAHESTLYQQGCTHTRCASYPSISSKNMDLTLYAH
jgi:hypothetical protein